MIYSEPNYQGKHVIHLPSTDQHLSPLLTLLLQASVSPMTRSSPLRPSTNPGRDLSGLPAPSGASTTGDSQSPAVTSPLSWPGLSSARSSRSGRIQLGGSRGNMSGPSSRATTPTTPAAPPGLPPSPSPPPCPTTSLSRLLRTSQVRQDKGRVIV